MTQKRKALDQNQYENIKRIKVEPHNRNVKKKSQVSSFLSYVIKQGSHKIVLDYIVNSKSINNEIFFCDCI